MHDLPEGRSQINDPKDAGALPKSMLALARIEMEPEKPMARDMFQSMVQPSTAVASAPDCAVKPNAAGTEHGAPGSSDAP